ncbi:hypothetical protein MOC97_11165 [Bacillus atrophaeus]|uniref:hypothetical protein n=1 Tax=Bacillus atrophaeus TaxID=1452 RepID=UPI0007C43F49|nr:hypothetical protein [Bacillus atrophaeus]MCY8486031.1 hypothetical protein [Bacillus atrophaeus]WFE15338.1 hypothetical protein P4829_06505 [Bacillus atrophaeus]
MNKIIRNTLLSIIIMILVIAITIYIIFLGGWYLIVIGKENWVSNYFVIISYAMIFILYTTILLRMLGVRKPAANLFEWMDRLKEYRTEKFVERLQKQDVSESLLENLEAVKRHLLIYTKSDINKLRMLRAYVRAHRLESSLDIVLRAIITLLPGPIMVFILGNNSFRNYFKIDVSDASNQLISVLSVLSAIVAIFYIIILLSFAFRTNKKRLKLIEEMIDVCIDELENK